MTRLQPLSFTGPGRVLWAAIVCALLSASLGATVAASRLSALSADSDSTFVPISDPAWFWSPYNWNTVSTAPGQAQSNNPGAYFKLAFTGSSFTLGLNMTNTPSEGYMTLRWSVDGAAWQNALLPWSVSSSDSLQLARDQPPNPTSAPHSLVLFVLNSHQLTDRWETPLNIVRITGATIDAGAALSPYPFLFSRRLMVYWDSIGEGVKINGVSSPPSDLTDNDSTRNWVQVLAQSLQAEVGSISYGAQGWLHDGSFHALMNVYNDTEASFAWSRFDSHTSRLDASGLLQPPPDWVVMGHATNDHASDPAQVSACAEAWLGAITAAAPDSHVFLTVPFGRFQSAALGSAYAAFQKSVGGGGGGNPLVHLTDLTAWNAQEGLAGGGANRNSVDGVHPLAFRAEQLGGLLATAITQQLSQVQEPRLADD